ncbi:hypothetical protein CF8_0109 [Aeromonas phage CF8]|nr:hypothetical protein CF8_0109 [Aeromonas phage CF8]
MFNVDVPSSETYKISLRPAVFKTLATIIEYFNISQNHKIFFNGEAEVSKLLGGLYNNRRGDDIATDVGYDDKIFVELEEDYSGYNDGLDSESRATPTTPNMWYDPVTKSSLRAVFQNRKYTVTLYKYFKDRNTAQTFHRKIRSAMLSSHQNNLFDMKTHYPIPWRILECFKSIYDKQVKAGVIVESPTMNFIKWFRALSELPTDIISNLIGNNDTLVFVQELANNGIDFGDAYFAKVTKGAYIGKYEVSWNYSFYWNDHAKWEVKYPIQVYQQPMEDEWIPDVFEQNQKELPTSRFMESKLAGLIFRGDPNSTVAYHALPRQDNWRPNPINWLSPQMQVLINVDDSPEQVLININQLQGFTWNGDFIKWIIKYKDKVTKRAYNPMNFKVYSDDTEVLETQIELRENGDLVLLRPATISNIYRVVFSLDYALRQYTEQCVNDIVSDPEYGQWIINLLFPGLYGTIDWDNPINWWDDIHNKVDNGDGEEVIFFERGTMGMVIFAHNQSQQPKLPW